MYGPDAVVSVVESLWERPHWAQPVDPSGYMIAPLTWKLRRIRGYLVAVQTFHVQPIGLG